MDDYPKEFQKTTIPLPALHGWQCKPGNHLFVAERGAVAFEIRQGWVVRHEKQTLTIHDQAPPADQARISLTIFHLPPVKGGWGELSLAAMMLAAEARPKKKKQKAGAPPPPLEVHTEPRADMDLVWADKGLWPDPESGRPIHCRQIMGRARLVQVLITLDIYQDMVEKFEYVWKDLLRSLRVAVPRDITGQVGN